jgi:serine/threonine-protein kinase
MSRAEPSLGGTRATVDIRREMKQCPTCAHRFSRDAGFCPFDGAKLESAKYDPLGDPLLGTTIDGRYEVQSLLGEGGMGQVYQVRHTTLERLFALKALRSELARDEELSARFIQEARATASVRHPNVVEITDFGKMPTGVPYFVMDLLVGQSLGDVIKSGGPLPGARAVRIARQIASALGATHAAGIVHRDLKPDNVFLVGGVTGGAVSDNVRIVDFGAAKIIGSSRVTRQGIVFGTPAYMSPEQASGQPVDHRADIYALGVILYEMLAGRVPFEADTYMGVLTQHMFVQPLPPSRLVPAGGRELGALEEITLICLAKKPEERFASMPELIDALDAVVRFREDGTAQIAPRLEARPGRPPASIRFRMADELEPPTLEEMRVRIDSVLPPRRAVPWGWLVGFAVVLVTVPLLWAFLAARSSSHTLTAPPLPGESSSAAAPPRAPSAAPSQAATGAPPPTREETQETTTATAHPTAPAVDAPPPAPHAVPRRESPVKPNSAAAPPNRTKLDDVGDPFAAKH